jgi:hypothetical protein
MTNLSPAAQAVLDAIYEIKDPMAEDGAVIAAALRAAARELRESYASEQYVDSADDWLDGIAAELDPPH